MAQVVEASSNTASTSNSRPVHPAVLSIFGPGKGSGSSEFSVWAYLTRPRPSHTVSCHVDAPLPNLVTAQSNSLRVYTVLPHAGTLALTAIYDNLAGTICSLDTIPNGTGGGDTCICTACSSTCQESGKSYGASIEDASADSENDAAILDDDLVFMYDKRKMMSNEGCTCCYDGLLIGFAGHPRLSLVYPSAPMVGGSFRKSSTEMESKKNDLKDYEEKENSNDGKRGGVSFGVGQGGVLLASSIIDLTPALIERSIGGLSCLEQDIVVCVSTTSSIANGVDLGTRSEGNNLDEHDPNVSVVVGGGVAIASFSLPKGPRPQEGNGHSTSSWWRVASEPYILPLSMLASKVRCDFGGVLSATHITSTVGTTISAATGSRAKNHPSTFVSNAGVVGHGFGDILDIVFLSGYTEPTLLILHTNPKKGGGRSWAGRMGRIEEIPIGSNGSALISDEVKQRSETKGTGTKYGLSLTAISIANHQQRSVVLWSLLDAIPSDAWRLVPHPKNGVVVFGVNTIVYVSIGGKIRCALAVNGFAKIGCPVGLIPPSVSTSQVRHSKSIHLESNPSPLPLLSLQLDGARVGFVTEDLALVCSGNGSLYSLEIHRNSSVPVSSMFMSLSPLGHRVGGLGFASCLSVMATGCHTSCIDHYLNLIENGKSIDVAKKEMDARDIKPVDEDIVSNSMVSGPGIRTRGLVFIGSRVGDCTLLAFSINKAIRLVLTDVELNNNTPMKRTPDVVHSNCISSMSESSSKRPKNIENDTSELQHHTNEEELSKEEIPLYDDDLYYDTDNHKLMSEKEEILFLEEEELYREDVDDSYVDVTAPNLVSPSRADSNEYDVNDGISNKFITERRLVRFLSTFRTIGALDSLTGLGPLGPGCYGTVATLPPVRNQDEVDSFAPPSNSHESFCNSSAARHYVMPCGFGQSGGLAILTTPGRDTVNGSILCEADLCNMSGSMFSLSQSNLLLLGKLDDIGAIVLRGVLRVENTSDEKACQTVEEFEEVDVSTLSHYANNEKSKMDDDSKFPSFLYADEVISKMTLLAVTEFSSSVPFSVFFVKSPREGEENGQYSIVLMVSNSGDESATNVSHTAALLVKFVHHIDPFIKNCPRSLSSITPMVSNVSEKGIITSVSFGCVWSCGHGSLFNLHIIYDATNSCPCDISFEVSESIFVGDDPGKNNDLNNDFYQSNNIVSMDVVSLPDHVFEMSDDTMLHPSVQDFSVASSSLSFPPDRLSMHGTWCSKLNGNSAEPPYFNSSKNVVLIAICRRSGLLQIYDNVAVIRVCRIENSFSVSSNLSPTWQAHGCSHGVSFLGQCSSNSNARTPALHEVEASEIRLFISGPSLTDDLSVNNAQRDAWMLRSLCILVETSLGDLHLYSGSKRTSNLLEFSRVPLSCVARPSEEANRHFMKLRRKGIVTPIIKSDFRANRLHRFCNISSQDGLFAATPRPLWFVSERGAPTVVSHKFRHVSPAGGRPVPVSGFCNEMPNIFQNASKGFITLHERIGRVGSQRLTLFNGLWDIFAPHGLLPGGGMCIQKYPIGVTVRQIEFIDDANISTRSRPIYVMLISHEFETEQNDLNDDSISPDERQRLKEEKEAAQIRKQVEADLSGFDIEQEWVEEIQRENCFEVDKRLGLAPPIPSRKFEVWLVDAASQWSVIDKYELDSLEHGMVMKVLYLTDIIEDSDDTPRTNLFVAVGTGIIELDGEDLASRGRILLFQVKKLKHRGHERNKKRHLLELVLKNDKEITIGPVTSLASLSFENILRVVVGAGAEVTVEQWGSGKLTQVGFYHAHMQVQEITIFKTFVLLSDAYDSLHFLVWRESDKSLTLLAKDYEPCQVYAAGLISIGSAMSFICHDDRQNLQFFQYAPSDQAARGGNKLVCRADFHLGAQTTAFRTHWGQSSLLFNSCTTSSTLSALKQQDALFGRQDDDQKFAVNFGTTDGSFASIIPLSEPTFWRLTALQSVMANAIESNCALSHRSWRLFRRSTRRGGCRSNDRKKGVIDGDLISKFVDLPMPEQEDLASSIGSTVGLIMDNLLELRCAGSVL